MPVLLLDSLLPCAAEVIGHGVFLLDGSNPALLSCRTGSETVIRYCGLRKSEGTQYEYALSGVCSVSIDGRGSVSVNGCSALVWGNLIQVILTPEYIDVSRNYAPVLLSGSTAVYKGAQVKAELYRDNGTRLALLSSKEELLCYYAVGNELFGELTRLETGRKSMLVVRLFDSEEVNSSKKQRMILLDENMDTVLDICAHRAWIADGRPQMIENLNTVCGMEKRTVFDLKDGKAVERSIDTGYFTHEKQLTKSNRFCALRFMQTLNICNERELSDSFAGDIFMQDSLESIRDFVGETGLAILMPDLYSKTPVLFGRNFYKDGGKADVQDNDIMKANTIEEEEVITVGVLDCSDAEALLNENERPGRVFVPRRFELHMRNGKMEDIVCAE